MKTATKTDSVNGEGGEMTMMRAWAQMMGGATPESTPGPRQQPERHSPDLPFSFLCGARSSRAWVTPESATRESGEWHHGRRVHHLRWADRESALTCSMELTEYEDFPAMEWVVRLRGEDGAETEPIRDFKALDTTWHGARENEMPELRRAFGSDGRCDDFQLVREDLRRSMWDAGQTVRMDGAANTAFRKTRNGSPDCFLSDQRPSATWLPFFNLCTGADGLFVGLGWSGRWFAQFAHDGKGSTALCAGMEHMELRLRPGEEIRSPRIALLHWQGKAAQAHNRWRQFVLRHHSPAVGGQPAQVPLCSGSWGGTPTAEHLAAIEEMRRHGLAYDYYWVDAGWYGHSTRPCPSVFEGEWSSTVGDWSVNPLYHPQGLKPVSDAAHRAGMKFLLWIEPERAVYGTPVTLEHPEWFLRTSREAPRPGENMLLNLAHPEAWRWALETVSALIGENGVDCYREDFNMDPGPFWDAAAEPGRKGMLEIRFVEGLYAFWDELRRRHPNLLIDNCASGGRRLELELLSRSIALWRTDYNCFPHARAEASQAHTAGLQLWLPLNSTSPMAQPGDTYQTRSAYSAGLILSVSEYGIRDWRSPDFPWNWFRSRLEEARRLRPFFSGDYYPLTPGAFNLDSWLAHQWILPEQQAGAVLAFRKPESPMTSACFQLHGIEAAGTYAFEDADGGEPVRMTGRDLMEKGLPLAIGTPRASRLLFFHREP